MKPERSRFATGLCRVALAPLLASLLASCTSAGDQQFDMRSPGFAASDAAAVAAVDSEAGAGASAKAAPDQADFTEASDAPESDSVAAAAPAKLAAARRAAAPAAQPATPAAAAADDPQVAPSGAVALADATPPDLVDGGKRAFLSSFLTRKSAAAATPKPLIPEIASATAPRAPVDLAKAKPLIKLASAEPGDIRAANPSTAFGGDDNALPGVRQTMLFEIKRKSGIDDDSDVDVHEEDDTAPIQVAYAAGMARLAPNGLLKQNETVDTACLKPALVATLKLAEQHFGKRAIITSGYRSPAHNRRVNGAKHSMHMACAAADVQMPGISKWELASYFRSMPGRGGVGTYCHTASVHVDVGPERDWNWRCRGRG